MKHLKVLIFVLAAVALLTACSGVTPEQFSAQATQVAELKNQQATQVALLEKLAETPASTPTQEPTDVTSVTPTATAVVETTPLVGVEGLSSPELHHAGEDPAGEADPGLFDIGVNEGQYGLAFGWNLAWGAYSIPGEGCELVILVPGWYEDFEITDGRYEVYDLPSTDPSGWAAVLLSQRIAEQADHYGCPAQKTPPSWGE